MGGRGRGREKKIKQPRELARHRDILYAMALCCWCYAERHSHAWTMGASTSATVEMHEQSVKWRIRPSLPDVRVRVRMYLTHMMMVASAHLFLAWGPLVLLAVPHISISVFFALCPTTHGN